MNAFLLKNKRKTLGIVWCLLFSRVFGFPPFLRMRSGQLRFLPAVKNKCQDIDDEECPVEGEVLAPAQVFQNPAAGAGDTLPYVEQAHGNINGECREQAECRYKPGFSRAAAEQQGYGGQFQQGQDIDEDVADGMRERLEVQLAPEFFNIGQFAGGGIAEQQDEQGWQDGGEVLFHMACFGETKYASGKTVKQW